MTAETTIFPPAQSAARSTGASSAAIRAGLDVDANISLLTEPQSLAAEAIRSLRTQIVARHVDAGRRALAMVAPTGEVGLTTLTINLAIALAQTGIRTLLVDADLRKPSVTAALGIASNPGLVGILGGSVADVEDVIIRDVIANLSILPAGATADKPHELLASGRFRQVVRETMREYDLTLYDTSPANQSPDAIAVANAAGYAIIMGRRDHSYTNDVHTLTGQLNDAGSVVIGSVLNVF